MTKKQWRARLAEFGYRCAYCLAPQMPGRQMFFEDEGEWCSVGGRRLEADHMDPQCDRGSNRLDNIVPACGDCNADKGGLTVLEWLGVRSGAWVRRHAKHGRFGRVAAA